LPVQIEVWGDYACFSRPELKVERVSYDIITPSAARGIIEAIYWHPGLKWIIDRIYVLNPIRFVNIRRNEVKSRVSAANVRSVMFGGKKPLYINTKDDIQQRAALILRDVHYIIEAHFEITEAATPSDNPGKFIDITRRRIEKGQCYHQPYLGCREFPAHFRLFQGDVIHTAYEQCDRDFGYMLYDINYQDPNDIKPMFFRAILKNGMLDLRDCEVLS